MLSLKQSQNVFYKSVAVIVVNHDRRLGVDTVAMCCYLSPVSRSPDVTVVDMLQAGGRGSGWIINTGGTLSPGHSGCVGGWPRLSSSLTDPQLAVPRSGSAHSVSLSLRSSRRNCVLLPAAAA